MILGKEEKGKCLCGCCLRNRFELFYRCAIKTTTSCNFYIRHVKSTRLDKICHFFGRFVSVVLA
jgi:hypothetical protein